MNIRTHVTEAFRQLTASKLRAFLAVLGILVGTASVVAMVSIGELASAQILDHFKKLGINIVSVSIYPENYSSSNSNPNAAISESHAKGLIHISKNIQAVAPYVSGQGSVTYKQKSMQASSVGVTPAMMTVAKLHLKYGRRLSFLDHRAYYCMIGYKLYQQIQHDGTPNPLGKQIHVGKTVLTIVGILAPWPENYFFFNTNFNNAVLMPLSTAMAIQEHAKIENIVMRIKNTDQLAKTKTAIQQYVMRHTEQQRVMVRSAKTLINNMRQSASTMTLLLGMIGSISLLVGGIGVMNIMLVSVAERHREIGIRLAIGAKQRDIQLQFLIESITLSVFGGVTGMILGIVVTYIVAIFSKWHFDVFLMPPLLGCIVSILVGIFFGFYPAVKASKLDPIQTLRTD